MAERGCRQGSEASSSPADGGEGEAECPVLEAREQELTAQVPRLLEVMNRSSNEVNTYELLLAQTQRSFKKLLAQWTELYEALRAQHGGALDRVRPYFDAQQVHASASARVQDLVREFSAATALHTTAKQELRQLEREMECGGATVSLDPEHQEAFSRATVRVLKCQQEKDHREQEYANALREFQEAQDSMEAWRVQIGDAAIKRAMPSFRQLQSHQKKLAAEQARINALTERVRHAKAAYHNSMRELDRISTAVHEARREYREVEAKRPSSPSSPQGAPPQQPEEAPPPAPPCTEAEVPEEEEAAASPPRSRSTLAERLISQQLSQVQLSPAAAAAQPEEAPEARTPQAVAAAPLGSGGADVSPPPGPPVIVDEEHERMPPDHEAVAPATSGTEEARPEEQQQLAASEGLAAGELKAATGAWTEVQPPELSPESCPS